MRIAHHSIGPERAGQCSRFDCRLTAIRSLPRVWRLDRAHLQHEAEIYGRLLTIQGSRVPVCLGSINLVLPYYYDGGVYMNFLFLSWAGRPLFECVDKVNLRASSIRSPQYTRRCTNCAFFTVTRSHAKTGDKVMVVDFERSEILDRQPLGSKRKRGLSQKEGEDDFVIELEHAVEKVRCVARRQSSRAAFPFL